MKKERTEPGRDAFARFYVSKVDGTRRFIWQYDRMQPMPMNALVDDVLACGSDYLSVVASVQSVRRYCRKKMEGELAQRATHKQAAARSGIRRYVASRSAAFRF